MATKYAPDSFDAVREDAPRVGAHRGPKARGRVWRGLLIAAVGVVALTGIGWFAVQQTGAGTPTATGGVETAGGGFPDWDPEPARARHDANATVTVLNGTTTTGLAASVGDVLLGEDWNVVSEATSSDTDVEQTVVYYSHLDSEGAARALAEDLGQGVEAQLATYYAYGSAITVVVGTDYSV